MEMLALFVAYFMYESDANNTWWTAYWIIVGIKVVQMMTQYKEKKLKEIEEQVKYWEGK